MRGCVAVRRNTLRQGACRSRGMGDLLPDLLYSYWRLLLMIVYLAYATSSSHVMLPKSPKQDIC